MWNEQSKAVRVSDFWEPGITPSERSVIEKGNPIWLLQNQVPGTVARVLETTPSYKHMVLSAMPLSFTEKVSDTGLLVPEIPPRIYPHPEEPNVVFYNWSWKNREIQHYLSLTGRTQNEQAEVYLSTTQWMDIYHNLQWSPQEKVKLFQEKYKLEFYGLMDWSIMKVEHNGEAVYFWAREHEKYPGSNAMKLTKAGIETIYINNNRGLLLLLPKLEQ